MPYGYDITSLKPQRLSELFDHYHLKVHCSNCNKVIYAKIQKGRRFQESKLNDSRCSNCGCLNTLQNVNAVSWRD